MTRLQSQGEKATISLYTDWLKKARRKQLQPIEEHFIWLILAGRGWGKTRTGAQDIALYSLRNPNTISAVVAPTFGDLRRVCFAGPSGLMSIIPDDCLDKSYGTNGYSPTLMEIRLFNGSKIVGYAAINPERLRGPQFHRAWCDELCAWRYPETFDQLMFGLRLGENPQCIITTTPKPMTLLKNLLDREDVIITRGNTFENIENLAQSAVQMMQERYEGTTLGRQELYAEVLENIEGALWTNDLIENARLPKDTEKELTKIVVAIDPAVTNNANSDETGIIVVGKDANNEYYVLEDASAKLSADAWGKLAVRCFYEWDADKIIAEVNHGGDLVERLLRTVDPNVSYRSVQATRGKLVRAEPIAALYEQRRVHHIGTFPELETQMCTYTGERLQPSPDRLDALVWGLTELSKSSGTVQWRIT